MRRQPGQVRQCEGSGREAEAWAWTSGKCPVCGRSFGFLVAPGQIVPRHFVPRRPS